MHIKISQENVIVGLQRLLNLPQTVTEFSCQYNFVVESKSNKFPNFNLKTKLENILFLGILIHYFCPFVHCQYKCQITLVNYAVGF